MSTSKSSSSNARSSAPQSDNPASTVDGDEIYDGENSLDDVTDSSVASPIATTAQSAEPQKRKASKGKGKGRKTRISSACFECKKRRRKCTGEKPCQTCVDFQTECVYDPAMDRRSKSYFQKRLADGLAGALHSEKGQDELMVMIREHVDLDSDAVAEIQRTFHVREPPAIFSAPHSTTLDPRQESALSAEVPTGDRVLCRAFCGVAASGSPDVIWYPAEVRHEQERKFRGPEHAITPHVIPDSSPLSLIFENFKDGVRNMLFQGVPEYQVLGDLDPVVDLLFRSRRPDDPFSASTWACELARIDVTVDIFTQLANAFLLSRFMRWQLDPSLENYLLLPDLMRPTLAQRTIPHYAPADFYAIPAVRDCLISGNCELHTPIGRPGTKGIKFHWPFDMDKAICIHPMTGMRSISRLFGTCASDLGNWSCSSDFFVNSPMMRGLINVIDHQHAWDSGAVVGNSQPN